MSYQDPLWVKRCDELEKRIIDLETQLDYVINNLKLKGI